MKTPEELKTEWDKKSFYIRTVKEIDSDIIYDFFMKHFAEINSKLVEENKFILQKRVELTEGLSMSNKIISELKAHIKELEETVLIQNSEIVKLRKHG